MGLGCFPETETRAIIARAAAFLTERYSVPSGAFIHSFDGAGRPRNEQSDLYTQAFALFGLANAYAVSPEAAYKRRAISLADYLQRERRASDGGYTEIDNGRFVLRSNPHMHLFEAAIAWMRIDADPRWKDLASEILDLCLTKFIDPESGALCEYFSAGWTPARTGGHFVFEPGHHYEWSWLMTLYEESTGLDLGPVRVRLFQIGETRGLSPEGNAYDEVWSHAVPKKKSSRFWPQGERTKSAVRMGTHAAKDEQAPFARAADEAFESLSRFLQTPMPGLWRDTLLETGHFREEPTKASSLYHIINACDEYIALRPSLSTSEQPFVDVPAPDKG
jgi:mannose-6-phosphate isomerase